MSYELEKILQIDKNVEKVNCSFIDNKTIENHISDKKIVRFVLNIHNGIVKRYILIISLYKAWNC